MGKTIAIIGGTGREGQGLAYRWVQAGHRILIGSRTAEKAEAAVASLLEKLEGKGELQGMTNAEAVSQAEIAVLTVPFAAHKETLEGLKEELQGKVLIDVVVPLVPPKVTRVQMPPEGSALAQAKAVLGDDVKVVDAFVPLSEMFGYATILRSMTQGRASYSMEFNHYEKVPNSVAEKVINK